MMTDLIWMGSSSSDYLNYSRPSALVEGFGFDEATDLGGGDITTLFPYWNTSDQPPYNNRSQNDTAEEMNFTLPVWRQILWSILFGGMVIVATGGNLIVIWIVLAHKRMRTVTNYFLVNLSIADAMVSLLNVTFNYTYMLNSDWPFGRIYCKICQFVAILSICASVFTLMAISVDRYTAIMNPLKPRMGKRTTLCIAAIIWIVSFILSCPMLYVFTTFNVNLQSGEVRVVCYSEWPDGPTNQSTQETVYNVVFMFLTYILPIGSMSFTYARVGCELWGSQSIGECTQRQLENIKSKRRVVKMMMVVVLIFAICWLPYQIYFIVTSYIPNLTSEPYIQELYLGIYWLAMSNSMYNPIIYCWMNSRFRRGFQQFFRWCPFVRLTPETLTRRDVVGKYSCSSFPDHHRISRNETSRSFYYSCADPHNHRANSVRIPMHHSGLKGTPSSSTMMTSVTTNTSLQRMHSMVAINNSTDTHLVASGGGANCHLTASSAHSTSTTSTGISSGGGCNAGNNDSLISANTTTNSMGSNGDTLAPLIPPPPPPIVVGCTIRNGTSSSLSSSQHLCPSSASSATAAAAGPTTGLVNHHQLQPFNRWTTPPPAGIAAPGNFGNGSSGGGVVVRRSFS